VAALLQAHGGTPVADAVISDMAHSFTGESDTDHVKQMALAWTALAFAAKVGSARHAPNACASRLGSAARGGGGGGPCVFAPRSRQLVRLTDAPADTAIGRPLPRQSALRLRLQAVSHRRGASVQRGGCAWGSWTPRWLLR
jgi:hypothetical protein